MCRDTDQFNEHVHFLMGGFMHQTVCNVKENIIYQVHYKIHCIDK